jgi:hypothetical protein
MSRDAKSSPVLVAETSNGIVSYLVAQPPEALPPVQPRDLERAWYQARAAAIAARDGPPRIFRFHRPEGESTDLALTDPDARCWAAAVDAARGIDNLVGLSVCLRLLALVDLFAHADWAKRLVALRPDGAEIDPDLLRAAATTSLTREARFDAPHLQARLSPRVLSQAKVAPGRNGDFRPPGAST